MSPTFYDCIWKKSNSPFFVLFLLNAAKLIQLFNYLVTELNRAENLFANKTLLIKKI